ncbi:DNA polymerase IV [Olegusella massiliensis]|uniref:DNA polymerase IV n=1 Tax=Olegusella massiliensis TaxID=1776381 RepID=UPI000838955F|nr:DNA polymerase IV [Olegusella massiliensis]
MTTMENAHDDRAVIPWSGRAIGLLDLDAFFASVEQLDHPEWRGKPLIVGGSSKHRGVVSTASYEARKFGIHSAMPSFQAERLCPQAIWTEGHFSRYRELSAAVMNILVDETPLVEQVSIDEAFFDITPGRYAAENPLVICRRIQNRVEKLGISCSIGLGINKTIAKIASEREKPRGLTIVPPGTEALFLAPLPVRAMSGIGSKAEARLQSLHIKTLGQLAQADPQQLRRILGSYGPRLIERAAGKEQSVVAERAIREAPKSVSSERTFAHDLCDKKDVYAAVLHVAALTGARLRKKGLKGSELSLKLKFDFNKSHTIQRQLDQATDDEHEFAQVALELLEQIWHEGSPVRLVGVGISNFGANKSQQLSLFETESEREVNQRLAKKKRDLRRLALTTDELKSRFGNSVIAYGHDLRLRGELNESGRSK